MIYRGANIKLVQNSMNGKNSEFSGQLISIISRADVQSTGVDGHTSTGQQLSVVDWRGAVLTQLTGVTDVVITDLNGKMILEGSVMTTFNPPASSDEGVRFEVLPTSS